MNIAFLTSEYPHPETGNSGGIGTSIKNLAQALNRLNHNVLIFIYGQTKDSTFYDEGIKIYQIKNIKIKGFSWWFTAKKIENIINKLIIKKEIDIIEIPDWTGISAFLNLKCPIVLRLHGSDTYFCHLDNRPVKWWNKFQEKKAYLNADSIVAVSKFTGRLTNQLFKTNREFSIIPNGLNCEKFSPSIKCEENIILYFGTLIRKKGLLEIPHIFNKVYENYPNVKLILIGKDSPDVISGSQSTWQIMKEIFSEKAVKNVIHKGIIPYNQVKSEIEKATLCIFPSFAEAFPVSWLEAMSMKKPIVASNIGWAVEMIENEVEGILIYPKNHQEFANKICEVIDNKELQMELGENARNKVIKSFENNFIASKMENFYKKTLNL